MMGSQEPLVLPSVGNADLLRRIDWDRMNWMPRIEGRNQVLDPEIKIAFPDKVLRESAETLIEAGARYFDEPTDTVKQLQILWYRPGVGVKAHADRAKTLITSCQRTLALSLILCDEHTGGAFYWLHNGKRTYYDLKVGDAVMFTADTWHGIDPVSSGRRVALVAFGENSRRKVASEIKVDVPRFELPKLKIPSGS